MLQYRYDTQMLIDGEDLDEDRRGRRSGEDSFSYE